MADSRNQQIKELKNIVESEATGLEYDEERLRKLSIEEKVTQDRGDLARFSIKAFFGILLILFIFIPIYNSTVTNDGHPELILDLENNIQVFASVVGTFIGLMVGYYFKGRD